MSSYLRSWRVTTTAGAVTVLARCRADAIAAAIELTGAATVLTCLERSDW